MPYILSKSCTSRSLLNDIFFNVNISNSRKCQVFITANIVVIFHKACEIYVYYKRTLHELRRICDRKYVYKCCINQDCMCINIVHYKQHFKNIYNLVRHKLNYSRACKYSKYRKYIDYSNVITNIVDRLFSVT